MLLTENSATVLPWGDAAWAWLQPRSPHGRPALNLQQGLGSCAERMVQRAGAAASAPRIEARPGILTEPGQPHGNRKDGERGGIKLGGNLAPVEGCRHRGTRSRSRTEARNSGRAKTVTEPINQDPPPPVRDLQVSQVPLRELLCHLFRERAAERFRFIPVGVRPQRNHGHGQVNRVWLAGAAGPE